MATLSIAEQMRHIADMSPLSAANREHLLQLADEVDVLNERIRMARFVETAESNTEALRQSELAALTAKVDRLTDRIETIEKKWRDMRLAVGE